MLSIFASDHPHPIKTYLWTNLTLFFAWEGVGNQNTIGNISKNMIWDQKLPFLRTFSFDNDSSYFTPKIWKSDKTAQNLPKTVDNHQEQLVFGLG